MTDLATLAIRIDATETKAATAELDRLTAAGVRAERSAGGLVSAQQQVTRSVGEQRAGMQQLSFQIGDVAQQFALGTNPMMIFAQQGGQVVQALNMMKGGASGLVGFLAGPWGAVIMGATMILGPLIAKMWEGGDAADGMREAETKLAASMTDLANSRAELDEALGRNIGQYRELRIAAIQAGISEVVAAQQALVARRAELATAQRDKQVRGSGAVQGVPLFGSILAATGFGDTAGAITSVTEATATLNEQSAKLNRSTATLQSLLTGGGGGGGSGGRGGGVAGGMSSHARATDEAAKATNTFIASLETEIDRIGKSEYALRQMAVAGALETATTDEQRRAITELSAAREQALGVQQALNDLQQRFNANADKLGAGLFDVPEYEAKMAVLPDEMERAAKASEILNDQMRELIGMVGSQGGVGAILGTLLGVATGNISSIGGPFGDLLNIGVGGTKTDQYGREVARTLGDELRGIFKMDGDFGKTMTKALQGAGIGMVAGASVFGQQNALGQLSSGIGGALGQAAGESLTKGLSGLLGSAGGPLGAIAGGIIGGLVGKVFSSSKYGTASLSGPDSMAISAKGGGRAEGATSLGGAVVNGLKSIAEMLGGSVGSFSTSIGTYKGDYRVSSTGRTGKLKGKYGDVTGFGDDQAAAIAFAIADAIKDGAVTGLSASVSKLIKGGTDLEAQLQKALSFQGVFDELKSLQNPLQYALDSITKQFDALRKIFVEAGATAAEYADLEALLALKRQEAIDAAQQDKLDKITDKFNLQIRLLELMGKSEQALTAARMLEIAGMDAALRPLQAMVYQLEDARAVIDKFGPLAAGLRAFKEELLGSSSPSSFALVTAQYRTTARKASVGDATALAALQGDATSYLDAAKANASTALEYQRAVSEVLVGVNKGIFAADTQVLMAQKQIDAVARQTDVMSAMRAELAAANLSLVGTTGALLKLWQRFESDGLTVKTAADTPLRTVAA